MDYHVTQPTKHSGRKLRMDKSSRRTPSAQQRELGVVNQKADKELRHRLEQLEKQYRFSRKVLQQRRRSLVQEQTRVVAVKVCEPKATVDIAMRDLNAETLHRRVYTSYEGERDDYRDSEPEPSRSISAPPPSTNTPLRHRGHIQASVSLMQMKNLVTIDSISEKEQARKQQRAREEQERIRRFQWEVLHNKVQEFIDKLSDKRKMNLEPP